MINVCNTTTAPQRGNCESSPISSWYNSQLTNSQSQALAENNSTFNIQNSKFIILKSIIAQIKTGKIPADDVAFLDKGIAKIAKMEAYEEYGSPFCVMDWRKFMDSEK